MAPRIDGRRLRKRVFGLLGNGRAGEARKLIEVLLRQRSQGSRGERGTLLDVLCEIEAYSDRNVEALTALNRRRSLGFRTTSEGFNAAFLAARLLMKTGRYFAARTE